MNDKTYKVFEIYGLSELDFDNTVKTRLFQGSVTSETCLLQEKRGSHHRKYH